MQFLPGDENGFVCFGESLSDHLENLRCQAILNAVVESDTIALRTHLVEKFRALGLTQTEKLKVWEVKHALLQANLLCLDRLQILVLVGLSAPDLEGDVDIEAFLATCCVLIPHMFTATTFVATAERLQAEHEERKRRADDAEFAAAGKALNSDTGGEEEKEEPVIDKDTVERTLTQVFAMSDDTHRNPPALPPEKILQVLFSADAQVMSCQLSEPELCVLAAEMTLDARGEVVYGEHVKQWVPILFELRKHPLYSLYLADDAVESMGIEEPDDLAALQDLVPLLPSVSKVVRRTGSRKTTWNQSLLSRTSSQRNSTFEELLSGEVEAEDGHAVESGGLVSRQSTGHDATMENPLGRGHERRRQRLAEAAALGRSASRDGSKRRSSSKGAVRRSPSKEASASRTTSKPVT